jgi:Papain-like cysteine protease AvrRpt2
MPPKLEEFRLERQEHSLWCWAAVSTSVDHYFSQRSTSSQCRIAKKVLGRKVRGVDCCRTPLACNQTALLQVALAAVGRLRGRPLLGVLTPDQIKREIDRNRPVCVFIKWSGGGGHFVVICNYDKVNKVVDVADPRYPPGTTISMRYRDFVSGYNLGLGRWMGTFRVQP